MRAKQVCADLSPLEHWYMHMLDCEDSQAEHESGCSQLSNSKKSGNLSVQLSRQIDMPMTHCFWSLTLSGPVSLSVYKFSLHYPHKTSCLVMRIKQMIIHNNLSKIKSKILPTCLQRNYRQFKEEFGNTSYDVFGAERVTRNVQLPMNESYTFIYPMP